MYSNISQTLLLYKTWRYYNKFDPTKSLGVRYRCVKIAQCGWMEHGFKDIAFYVQKHITPCTIVITSLLVRDKPLGSPASVKGVYWFHTHVSSIVLWAPRAAEDAGSQHDDVIKWKHFPRNWPFVRGIHRSPVNSPHKGQWRGALMFTLICARIYGWVNTREAGDLRRYRLHYDVIVMDPNPLMATISELIQHTSIALDNGLSPVRHQAIIWTNAAIWSIRP